MNRNKLLINSRIKRIAYKKSIRYVHGQIRLNASVTFQILMIAIINKTQFLAELC